MNALAVRRPAMQYRDLEFSTRPDNEELGTDLARQQSDGKQYRSKRRHEPHTAANRRFLHPGLGISGRRNRRWTW